MPLGQVGHGHGRYDDVADALPPSAATRLHALRMRASDAQGAMRLVLDDIAGLRDEKFDYESQLRVLQAKYRDNRMRSLGGPEVYEETEEIAKLDAATRANARLTWIGRDDPPQMVDLKKKINRAFAEMTRLTAANEARSALWNARGGLVHNVETYLRNGIPRGCTLHALPEPAPVLPKGGNIIDALEGKRRRRSELAADLHATRSAPILAAMARQRAHEKIEALAARGEPDISRLMYGGDLELPEMEMTVTPVIQSEVPLLIVWRQPDAIAYLTWLHKDAALKKIDAMIASEDDGSGLSDETRSQRENEILHDTRAVEREECALIEMAHALGMSSIEFSADCSPLALQIL